MNGNGEYYCYECHELVRREDRPAHVQKGHDIDDKPQSYYEEMERAAAEREMQKSVWF